MTQHPGSADSFTDSLVKLGDADLKLVDNGDDLRDRKVLDSEGQNLGHVSALFIDKVERKVRFIQVGAGGCLGLGEREFLIPAKDIKTIYPAEIHISHTREHVQGAPHYGPKLVRGQPQEFCGPCSGYCGLSPYWI
jgi:sporulation protein YlmC with PRC-barrel domain